jgi:SAM-dependent methyltransferase
MDTSQQLKGAVLASALWQWTNFVFKPAQAYKKIGLYNPASLGNPPSPQETAGHGPELSTRLNEPVFMPGTPDDYHLVEAFDDWAEDYGPVVDPFINPILDETFSLMADLIGPRARILDPSCGPAHAAIRLSKLYPEGEVVCADLSRGMVQQAHDNAREAGRNNMAFYQADVGDPPAAFDSYFDVIFSSLSFHHYPDGQAAANSFNKVLKPGGQCFIVDGGPRWFVELARPISQMCDPGFIQHRTGEDFTSLLRTAGFTSVYWVELLPGIGITIGTS